MSKLHCYTAPAAASKSSRISLYLPSGTPNTFAPLISTATVHSTWDDMIRHGNITIGRIILHIFAYVCIICRIICESGSFCFKVRIHQMCQWVITLRATPPQTIPLATCGATIAVTICFYDRNCFELRLEAVGSSRKQSEAVGSSSAGFSARLNITSARHSLIRWNKFSSLSTVVPLVSIPRCKKHTTDFVAGCWDK